MSFNVGYYLFIIMVIIPTCTCITFLEFLIFETKDFLIPYMIFKLLQPGVSSGTGAGSPQPLLSF